MLLLIWNLDHSINEANSEQVEDVAMVRKVWNAVSLQYILLAKETFQFTIFQRNIWKIQDGGCWHVCFATFVTILLNRPHCSHRFIYLKALLCCNIHQGKIYKTQRVLVTNLATNIWILVTSMVTLIALATVLGTILCPDRYPK